MKPLKCSHVIDAVGGILVTGDEKKEFLSISTDSRTILPGSLFVALKGENYDGHDFLVDALEGGGAGALVEKEYYLNKIHENIEYEHILKDKILIITDDTLVALGRIAAFVRDSFTLDVVGVTGSVGKTTTKDMIGCVLSKGYKILKTRGNYNNEIGLPLTVFDLDATHEVGVFELGMSMAGEISRLSSIIKPKVAVITNIGHSHIEKLGSRQAILEAKTEIFENLKEDGIAILNGDDSLLYGLKDLLKFPVFCFGMDEGLDYQAYNVKNAGEGGIYFDIVLDGKEHTMHIPVPGVHNIYNGLAAVAAGHYFNISPEKIKAGLKEFRPEKMRLNILNHGGIKIINDVYNASSQSVKAAFSVLLDLGKDKRKIALLGDILELGGWAESIHRELGRIAFELKLDYIITVGNSSKFITDEAVYCGYPRDRAIHFNGNMDVTDHLKGFLKDDDVLLVKGSRGMKMEEIVAMIINDYKEGN